MYLKNYVETYLKILAYFFHFQATSCTGDCLIEAYKRLSKMLATAVFHEEMRCGYLSSQRDHMLKILDDFAATPEGLLMVSKLFLRAYVPLIFTLYSSTYRIISNAMC